MREVVSRAKSDFDGYIKAMQLGLGIGTAVGLILKKPGTGATIGLVSGTGFIFARSVIELRAGRLARISTPTPTVSENRNISSIFEPELLYKWIPNWDTPEATIIFGVFFLLILSAMLLFLIQLHLTLRSYYPSLLGYIYNPLI